MSWKTLVITFAALVAVSLGHSRYLSSIPNGYRVRRAGVQWYGVGHYDSYGGGSPNAFGAAFAAAGYQWTADLCVADSDGDGQSNGVELGDPGCVWSPGETPSRTEDISHPGFADSTTSSSVDVATTPLPTSTATLTVTRSTATKTSTTTTSTTAEAPTATTTAAASSTSSSTVAVATESVTATTTATSSGTTATNAAPSTATETSTETTTASTSTTAVPSTATETSTDTTTVMTSTSAASTTPSTTVAASTTSTAPPTTSSTLLVASTSAASAANSTTSASTSTTGIPSEAGSPAGVGNSTSAEPDDGLHTRCDFENEPWAEGHYWDVTCEMGMLGCNADGKHIQCRLCGAGAFAEIPCPPSSCEFVNEPFVPYYWDPSCAMGKLGCWADGIHAQCRFCGDHPYTNIECPSTVGGQQGHLGSGGANSSHGSQCSFANEPAMPYFWDADCSSGKLGCLADGIHEQCRFCAQRPFEEILCPAEVAPPANRCTFPEGAEPAELYYWDAACTLGLLGCWADGIHAECRFCGGATFGNVTCPTVRVTGATADPDGQSSAQMAAASRVGSDRVQPGVVLDMRASEDDYELSGAAGHSSLLSCALVALSALMLRSCGPI